MGIEPTPSAWKADVLPLNYTRVGQTCRGLPGRAHLAQHSHGFEETAWKKQLRRNCSEEPSGSTTIPHFLAASKGRPRLKGDEATAATLDVALARKHGEATPPSLHPRTHRSHRGPTARASRRTAARHKSPVGPSPSVSRTRCAAKIWWAEQDSNLRRLCQQIYSLPPLAAWVSARECASFEGEVQAQRTDCGPPGGVLATITRTAGEAVLEKQVLAEPILETSGGRCLRSRLERTTR